MALDDELAAVASVDRAPGPSARISFLDAVEPAASVGVGSLPHRDVVAAAEFAMHAFDVVTIPSLPRRSPAESPVAQALVGVPGVTLGQYGTLAIDVGSLDPTAPVDTEVWRDNFAGFRTCLERAALMGYEGPLKWQFVGPISVGLALRRAGADPDVAFSMAARVVRSHIVSLASEVARALPRTSQLIVLDEPFLDDLMSRDFPIAPDEAVDLLSSAMAAVETRATVGVHACGDADVATLIGSGPKLLSLPAGPALVPYAGYIGRYLRNGGWIIWGAVPTEGPIGTVSGRSANRLEALWRELSDRGCDPDQLRNQSLISSQCGLGGLSTTVAERVCETVRGVSRAIRPA